MDYARQLKVLELSETNSYTKEEVEKLVYSSNNFSTLSTKKNNLKMRNIGEKYAKAMFRSIVVGDVDSLSSMSVAGMSTVILDSNPYPDPASGTMPIPGAGSNPLPDPQLLIDPKWISPKSRRPLIVPKRLS